MTQTPKPKRMPPMPRQHEAKANRYPTAAQDAADAAEAEKIERELAEDYG